LYDILMLLGNLHVAFYLTLVLILFIF
jgi:hypothetical protein